jgi:hypothetical protein
LDKFIFYFYENKYQINAFIEACSERRLDVVKLLLESHKFPDEFYTYKNALNMKSFIFACEKDQRIDIIDLLKNFNLFI